MSWHTPTRRYARLALPSDAAASFSVRHDAALLVHAGRASAHGGVQLSELDQAEVVGPSSARSLRAFVIDCGMRAHSVQHAYVRLLNTDASQNLTFDILATIEPCAIYSRELYIAVSYI